VQNKRKNCKKKDRSKIVLIHAMKECTRSIGTAPPILNLDTRPRSVDNLKHPPLYLRYPLYMRLGGPHSRSGRFEEGKNPLPVWELEHTIVELAAGEK
jgi:hypothetical protein